MTRPTRTLTSAAALGLLAATAIASPALAKPAPVVYDALGDSYASGYGVPPYDGDDCARSDAAYAVQIDGRMKIDLDDFAACAGATTDTLETGQLGVLDADTDLVTVSIGGNDIGWSLAVGACLLGTDQQCTDALAATTTAIQYVLPDLLRDTYDMIDAEAPDAHVVVTGYPRLFSPEYGDYFNASPAEQQAMNDGADLLNDVIAGVAGEYGFQFVDVTKRFDDHGVNAPEPWILGLTDPGLFHPNLQGYRAYSAAVTAAINPRDLR